MRVGLIVYGDLETISGGYLYDRQLVRYLREQGDTVEVISLPWENYGRHLLHNFQPAYKHILQNGSYDLLIQDELNHPSLFWLNRRLNQKKRYPIVTIVHHLRANETHPRWQMAFYERVEKAYLCSVHGYIFNSQTTRTAVESLIAGQRPSVVAYPAADHLAGVFDRAAIPARAHEPGPIRLLFVGNLIPRKGVADLIAALERVPAGAWSLEIVGDTTVDPDYVRHLTRQVIRSGLHEWITWHGRLAEDALNELYNTSQLLVGPSIYEGFGIVYLEGMAHGLPAIASTGGAAKEIITSGDNGYLIPPGNVGLLADRILELHQDRHKLSIMSQSAFQRFLVHPTWEKSMTRARDFLRELSAENLH